jgi:riboflavin kinase/FMN adenylyltransferase
MKVLYGINRVRNLRNPVLALGVFDGVHRGHINILKSAVLEARRIKGKSVVMTFYPHPQKEESLYSLQHRLLLFERLGIDCCIVVNFTDAFADMSAQEFIKEVLAEKIRARYIFVGNNFRFGKGAKGDLAVLKAASGEYHYKLRAFNVLRTHNKPVSSTYIRWLIRKGDLSHAQKLLTRPVSILGSVARGNYLGRKIGFPTANINPHHEVIPPSGIYAVKIIFGGKKYPGVCYIGKRPTINNPRFQDQKVHIEAHIFNFNKNIYNKYLEIQFIKKIREDRKFLSLTKLAEQIQKDSLAARKIL